MPEQLKWRVSRHAQAIEDETGKVLFATRSGSPADEVLAAAAPELLKALEQAIEVLHRAFDYVPGGHQDAACRGNLVPALQHARCVVRAAKSPHPYA